MCTVTWLPGRDGYHLFCSRDEKRLRQPARDPVLRMREGMPCISPLDPEGGGTWISVNAAGVATCILNGPTQPSRARKGVSRGRLVAGLAPLGSCREALTRLQSMDLRRFASFQLLLLEPDSKSLVLDWTTTRLLRREGDAPTVPLVSSSYDFETVARARRTLFEAYRRSSDGITPERLMDYHRSHLPQPGPYSVCMHREDAVTCSLTHIQVGRTRIDCTYWGSAPCRSQDSHHLSMRRQRSVHQGREGEMETSLQSSPG